MQIHKFTHYIDRDNNYSKLRYLIDPPIEWEYKIENNEPLLPFTWEIINGKKVPIPPTGLQLLDHNTGPFTPALLLEDKINTLELFLEHYEIIYIQIRPNYIINQAIIDPWNTNLITDIHFSLNSTLIYTFRNLGEPKTIELKITIKNDNGETYGILQKSYRDLHARKKILAKAMDINYNPLPPIIETEEACNEDYIFCIINNKCSITFNKQIVAKFEKPLTGYKYIHFLLSNSGKEIPANTFITTFRQKEATIVSLREIEDFDNNSDYPEDSNKSVDIINSPNRQSDIYSSEELKKWDDAIEDLQDNLEFITDIEEREEQEKKIKALEKERNKMKNSIISSSKKNSQQKTDYNSVRKAIKDSIDIFKKKNEQLGAYLESQITPNGKYGLVYHHTEKWHWKLK